MRHSRCILILSGLLLAATLVACPEEGADEGSLEPTSEGEEGAEEGAADKAAEGEEGAADKAAEGEEGATDKAAEGEAKAAEGEDGDPAAPGEAAGPRPTAEECKKACAHATSLSMAAMPEKATDDMKAAIEKVLTEGCPDSCTKLGSKTQVECYLNAKTAMDLAACPK